MENNSFLVGVAGGLVLSVGGSVVARLLFGTVMSVEKAIADAILAALALACAVVVGSV